jgi:hypothetical protein
MPSGMEEMGDFLFVLSKDDDDSATRCFQIARIAYKKGQSVNRNDIAAEAKIFLISNTKLENWGTPIKCFCGASFF